MRSDPFLLSLRPRFARAILNGTKTIDLRRRPVRAHAGTQVILYASAPLMAVVGTAKLQQVLVCDADEAWRDHGRRLGLDRQEVDDYLGGAPACLLMLSDVCELDQPVTLLELRRQAPFSPPQSFRYVSGSDPRLVQDLAEQGLCRCDD
jgi:predicted transcriptional regulator